MDTPTPIGAAPAAALPPPGRCTLGAFGVLELTGPDAVAFLHGQVTADLKALAVGASTLGAYCSAKGRVLCTFAALRTAQGLQLVMRRELIEPIRKRLGLYILRAKVLIEDASARVVVEGYTGPAGEDAPAAARLALSPHHGMCLCAALPPEPAPPPGGVPLTEADWAWVNITQGIAWVSAATQDSFTPHMLDLDRLGAVSFTKGCYPGQEVVARTQYLGKAKRRMYRLGFSAQGLPESGAPVYAPEGGDQPVGTFIDCARGPGGLEALVVLPSSAVAQGQIRALRPDGPLMQPLPLPFAIEA